MGKATTRLRRTFTPQFKKDAVRLVTEEGKSLTEVATHLGVVRSLLQRWKEQATSKPAADVFPRHGCLTGHAQKIRELIANALKQRPIGVEEVADGIWSIHFARVLLL